ncbi:dihydrodipicolinate synthase family protein [Pseudogemmobacter humi]|uniref:4-hydroxy-tetrahydrodipicolinate synthase n=1 Tax=Pseudogemmobacter humi TaxID=2483812 RepID=A0A3P5X2P4_9RHOB|nr:dihydrodipicolinate synthase family protein [Pseudogemmobacter humi]VDC28668.1 4-hydroxy-tetrahydrodipicolinate synthase [Pseudogemmobacter humi]
MTSSPWPIGVITAIVTPLRDDRLDKAALAALIDFQIGGGAVGLVVGGGTGEYAAMNIDERMELVREAVSAARGRIPIIAQTGAIATRDAVRLSRDAEEAGASGLLIASPYAEPISWRERLAFYREVTAAVSIPVMIYNTPPSGILTMAQVRELAELPNVSAIKDSSGDPELLGDLIAFAAERDFGVYLGKDSLLYEAIVTGARGVVFGVPNFIPEVIAKTIADIRAKGSTPGTLADWAKLRPFLRFIETSSNYISLCKLGCKVRGVDVGEARAPYLMPEAGEAAIFTEWVETLTAPKR